jgi:hypothetical protein
MKVRPDEHVLMSIQCLTHDSLLIMITMIEIYCLKCPAFTPLVFDEPYQWRRTKLWHGMSYVHDASQR